ncbi:MAG TPA: hypothetical protein VFN53_08420 [Acidobacteriaceae bacterium]|nr:hypothetical protein [Acidobacteriaceae bacterium]
MGKLIPRLEKRDLGTRKSKFLEAICQTLKKQLKVQGSHPRTDLLETSHTFRMSKELFKGEELPSEGNGTEGNGG